MPINICQDTHIYKADITKVRRNKNSISLELEVAAFWNDVSARELIDNSEVPGLLKRVGVQKVSDLKGKPIKIYVGVKAGPSDESDPVEYYIGIRGMSKGRFMGEI